LRDRELEPDIFHTKPEKSKTAWFNQFARILPERIAFYGAAAFGAYVRNMPLFIIDLVGRV
jgi:carnitine O-palmitoyltransferase 2